MCVLALWLLKFNAQWWQSSRRMSVRSRRRVVGGRYRRRFRMPLILLKGLPKLTWELGQRSHTQGCFARNTNTGTAPLLLLNSSIMKQAASLVFVWALLCATVEAGPGVCIAAVTTCCTASFFWQPALAGGCLACCGHCIPGYVGPVGPADVFAAHCCAIGVAAGIAPTP